MLEVVDYYLDWVVHDFAFADGIVPHEETQKNIEDQKTEEKDIKWSICTWKHDFVLEEVGSEGHRKGDLQLDQIEDDHKEEGPGVHDPRLWIYVEPDGFSGTFGRGLELLVLSME